MKVYIVLTYPIDEVEIVGVFSQEKDADDMIESFGCESSHYEKVEQAVIE